MSFLDAVINSYESWALNYPAFAEDGCLFMPFQSLSLQYIPWNHGEITTWVFGELFGVFFFGIISDFNHFCHAECLNHLLFVLFSLVAFIKEAGFYF